MSPVIPTKIFNANNVPEMWDVVCIKRQEIRRCFSIADFFFS